MRGKLNPFVSSEFALLGLLYEKPTHGYELHKQITDPEGIGMIWRIKMSNLYAQLEKLEHRGYITGEMHPGDTHPNRMEYSITKDGKFAFESWLETTVKHPRDFRQDFMARYFYLLKYYPEKVSELVQKQREECRTWLTNTKAQDQAEQPDPGFKKSVVEFRIAQIEAIIKWLEATSQG
jgi:DNA-binding PadR family transcriptional regulator